MGFSENKVENENGRSGSRSGIPRSYNDLSLVDMLVHIMSGRFSPVMARNVIEATQNRLALISDFYQNFINYI